MPRGDFTLHNKHVVALWPYLALTPTPSLEHQPPSFPFPFFILSYPKSNEDGDCNLSFLSKIWPQIGKKAPHEKM